MLTRPVNLAGRTVAKNHLRVGIPPFLRVHQTGSPHHDIAAVNEPLPRQPNTGQFSCPDPSDQPVERLELEDRSDRYRYATPRLNFAPSRLEQFRSHPPAPVTGRGIFEARNVEEITRHQRYQLVSHQSTPPRAPPFIRGRLGDAVETSPLFLLKVAECLTNRQDERRRADAELDINQPPIGVPLKDKSPVKSTHPHIDFAHGRQQLSGGRCQVLLGIV